jgi:large subunit ribosomal protein L15
MVVTRKKNTRQRGSKTHGCGSMKKRRGAGHRGGRGAAGSGKRGDCKKPSIWKNKKYFGVHGFASHVQRALAKPVNLTYIEGRIETLVKEGLAKKNNDTYILNLQDLGFQKLLSKGTITKKYDINCDFATAKAIEKVKKNGGNVTLSIIEKPKKQETKKE